MEIVRARGLFSLSNTDLVSTMDAPRYCEDCELDTFNPSPVMSSYLVALTISDFKNISSKTKSGKQVRLGSYVCGGEGVGGGGGRGSCNKINQN